MLCQVAPNLRKILTGSYLSLGKLANSLVRNVPPLQLPQAIDSNSSSSYCDQEPEVRLQRCFY